MDYLGARYDDDFEFFDKRPSLVTSEGCCPRLSLEEIVEKIRVTNMCAAGIIEVVQFDTVVQTGGEFRISKHQAKVCQVSESMTLGMFAIQSLIDLFSRHPNVYYAPKDESISVLTLDHAHSNVVQKTGHCPDAIWYSKSLSVVMSLNSKDIGIVIGRTFDGSMGSTGVLSYNPNSLIVIKT